MNNVSALCFIKYFVFVPILIHLRTESCHIVWQGPLYPYFYCNGRFLCPFINLIFLNISFHSTANFTSQMANFSWTTMRSTTAIIKIMQIPLSLPSDHTNLVWFCLVQTWWTNYVCMVNEDTSMSYQCFMVSFYSPCALLLGILGLIWSMLLHT